MACGLEVAAKFLLELFIACIKLVLHLLKLTACCFLPSSYKDIKNDIVLITGGGRGIGRRIAVEFAKYRPRLIILWGRNADHLSATCQAIRLLNVRCVYMCCDVGNRDQFYEKADEVKKTHGHVSILVNNAGVVHGDTVMESEDDKTVNTYKVNVLSHVWAAKAFVPAMIEENRGHIVNINSMLGFMGLAGAADYCGSKYAARGFADSLALELHSQGKDGIHITNIHPYMVSTDMFPGFTTRFPWMFPSLDPDYVARKTVAATLTNSPCVLMPRIMYCLNWVQSILPLKCMVYVRDVFRVDQAMKGLHKGKASKGE